jgi:hypothetical protein
MLWAVTHRGFIPTRIVKCDELIVFCVQRKRNLQKDWTAMTTLENSSVAPLLDRLFAEAEKATRRPAAFSIIAIRRK